MPDLDAAKRTLLAELREHSLILGEVTLASGATARYYVDARRALLRPVGFLAAGELIAAAAAEVGATAVGGPATAAIPPACAALAVPAGAGLVGFFVRGERKEHGLQRWVEGPVERGARCLVVEDTVTTGGSTARAIERIAEQGLEEAIRAIAAEDPAWLRVLIDTQTHLFHDPEFVRRMDAAIEEAPRVSDSLAELQRGGELRDDVSAVDLARFVGMVVNGLALRVASEDPTDVEATLKLLRDAIAPRK